MEKYHFIGIGGIGMSSLARILLQKNIPVSGSDISPSAITEELTQRGAWIFSRHAEENISPLMNVVFSTDIREDNPEYKAALRLGCRLLHRSEMLRELMAESLAFTVTGTHGKTTTSSLLTWTLRSLDPSFSVGGIIAPFETNGKYGQGAFFVAEADESDGSFLRYHPYGAIVTNIGFDHMPHFKNEANLISSFKQFMDQVENPDFLYWCGDDARLRSIDPLGISYGFSENCRLRCSNYRHEGWSTFCDIVFDKKSYPHVELNLIGRHNILNATAVFGMALRLGISEEVIRESLKSFGGTGRRCEKKGEHNSVIFIDDYAHHPTEIHVTLNALRATVGNQRLIAVFQPHRYTRTRDCMGTYGSIFNCVDQLIITDIYSAGEEPISGVCTENVLNEIKRCSEVSVRYVPRESIADDLAHWLLPKDVVVTLGAGNITKVGPETLTILKNKGCN